MSESPNDPSILKDEAPKHVGPYEIIGLLGVGGMGRVYRAHDPRLNRDVAVKMLPAEFSSNPQRKARFEQEAKAIAALNHPGIVSVFDVGDGWMVTELIEGQNLRQPGLPVAQVIDIGAQIADALAVAHEAGISHRDLKPENVMLTPDGRTKILDFGLAKVMDATAPNFDGLGPTTPRPEELSTLTNPGVPLGSPGYMAPEQVRGQATDQRADMFSLGVILYELLAGHPAFQAPSAIEVMHAIVHEEPKELPDTVPDGLQRIIKRCLEKKPSQRFQSARDLAFALRSLSTGNITHVVNAPKAGSEPVRKFQWVWPAVALLALAGVGAAYLLQSKSESSIAAYQFHPFSFSGEQEHSGVWSPDGKNIAFLQQSAQGTHLMVQSLDSPGPTQLVAQVNSQPGQVAWSADGTKIYFLAAANTFGGGGVQEISMAGGLPSPVLRLGRGKQGDASKQNGDTKSNDAQKNDVPKEELKAPPTSGAPTATGQNGAKQTGDGKQFDGRRGGKDFGGKQFGQGRGFNGKNIFEGPAANAKNGKANAKSDGKQFGPGPGGPGTNPGGRPAPPASTITAFDVSRDGNSLAIWRANQQADGSTTYSVSISSPIGSEPKLYEPAPFVVKTVFTPVFLRFSPNGKLLYLSMYTDTGAETWLLPYPAGSGKPQRIFADVAWNKPVAASWMPDSRRIVLSGNPVPATGEQLWMADVVTQTRTRLLASPGTGQATPAVSPDGKQILFSRVERDRDIVALPLDGSPPQTILATSLQEFAPSWSPTGDQFAYVTRRTGREELWVRSAEGTFDHPLVTSKDFPNLQAIVSPIFSPDGSRIAYTALLAGGGRRRSLAVSPTGGGTPTIISDGYAATWSPSPGGPFAGAFLAFLWLRPDGTLPVALMQIGADRPPFVIIPTTPGLGAPEWSPSGEWIAAASTRGVEIVSPSGRDAHTFDGLNGAALAWSKDSKTLYGLTFQAAQPSLSSMDVVTGVVKKIADYNLNFIPLLENTYTGSIRLSMSADGKSVATATAKNQADLWILDGFEK